MQAISVTTGKERPASPSSSRHTRQHAGRSLHRSSELQRPRCSSSGVVYAGFSGDLRRSPYRGVVIGVSTTAHDITACERRGRRRHRPGFAIRHLAVGRGSCPTGRNRSSHPVTASPPASAGGPHASTLSESVVRLTAGARNTHPTDYFARATPLARPGRPGSRLRRPSPQSDFGNSTDPDLLVQVGKDGGSSCSTATTSGVREQDRRQRRTIETLGPYNGSGATALRG